MYNIYVMKQLPEMCALFQFGKPKFSDITPWYSKRNVLFAIFCMLDENQILI